MISVFLEELPELVPLPLECEEMESLGQIVEQGGGGGILILIFLGAEAAGGGGGTVILIFFGGQDFGGGGGTVMVYVLSLSPLPTTFQPLPLQRVLGAELASEGAGGGEGGADSAFLDFFFAGAGSAAMTACTPMAPGA